MRLLHDGSCERFTRPLLIVLLRTPIRRHRVDSRHERQVRDELLRLAGRQRDEGEVPLHDPTSIAPDGPTCPWPPVDRDPETGFFRGEKPRVFSASRMTYPPGPGRPKGTERADLSGQKFALLTALERVADHVTPRGKTHPRYLCRCECGNEKTVLGANLKSGSTKSCGHIGFGRPYDVVGPLQDPVAAFGSGAEWQAHSERAAHHRGRREAAEADERERRKAQTRARRNARRRERYRQAAITRWAG